MLRTADRRCCLMMRRRQQMMLTLLRAAADAAADAAMLRLLLLRDGLWIPTGCSRCYWVPRVLTLVPRYRLRRRLVDSAVTEYK